jgi:hypothetical protein
MFSCGSTKIGGAAAKPGITASATASERTACG